MKPHKTSPRPRLALVSTIRSPDLSLRDFLNTYVYHGFARFYLFFDDPKDPDIRIAKSFPQSRIFIRDHRLEKCWRKLPAYPMLKNYMSGEASARLLLNAAYALALSRAEHMDWLFHLDSDELLFSPGGHKAIDCFAGIPARIRQVVFENWEAVPEKYGIKNPFRDVRLFKRNFSMGKPMTREQKKLARTLSRPPGSKFFNGYTNGKSACRVSADAYPLGVHRFSKVPRGGWTPWKTPRFIPLKTAVSKDLIVLHYLNCGLSRYYNKYRLLGDFADRILGSVPWGSFHLQSRDLVMRGQKKQVREYYRARIMIADRDEVRKLTEAEILVRLKRIPNRLAAKPKQPPLG